MSTVTNVITLVQDVLSGGGCACRGRGHMGKISVPSQIGCEPEPALKNKITIKRKRQTSGKKPT